MTSKRTAGVVLAAALVLLLAGCGGTGEADKTADQILADAAAALSSAKSVHIDATQTSGSGPFHLVIDLSAGGMARGTVDAEGTSANVIVAGGKFYIQGQSFFAKFAGAQAAAAIGDRWVIIPSSAGISGFESFTDLKTLGDCIAADHGTLSKGGTATVNGQAAVIVVDKGDKPGTAPGKLYVATSGTPRPLQVQITGETRSGTPPGGPKCADTTGTSGAGGGTSGGAGTLTFTQYDESVSVTPPPNPLDLTSLGG